MNAEVAQKALSANVRLHRELSETATGIALYRPTVEDIIEATESENRMKSAVDSLIDSLNLWNRRGISPITDEEVHIHVWEK